mmetsp:Transcript_40303/g.116493  ORF Transcript_40303/g.116493 Transcript_40303/m.116493 type:complete len:362 (-) Transcript_40303:252-1337(-)
MRLACWVIGDVPFVAGLAKSRAQQVLTLIRTQDQAKHQAEQVHQHGDEQHHPKQRGDADNETDDHVGEIPEQRRVQQLHQPQDPGDSQCAENHGAPERAGHLAAGDKHAVRRATLVGGESGVDDGGHRDEEVHEVPAVGRAAEIASPTQNGQHVDHLEDEDATTEQLKEEPTKTLGIVVDGNAHAENVDEDHSHDHIIEHPAEPRRFPGPSGRRRLCGLLRHLADDLCDGPRAQDADEVGDVRLELVGHSGQQDAAAGAHQLHEGVEAHAGGRPDGPAGQHGILRHEEPATLQLLQDLLDPCAVGAHRVAGGQQVNQRLEGDVRIVGLQAEHRAQAPSLALVQLLVDRPQSLTIVLREGGQ